MPTRRVLSAVAHNIGHSFTSLGSYYVDDSWPIQHLIVACRAAHCDAVVIDLLSGTISPPQVRSKSVLKALDFLRDHFIDMLERSGASRELVASGRLDIRFRLDEALPGPIPNHQFAPGVIVPERVPYECNVTIIDDLGEEHAALVKEWWRA